MMRGYKSFRFFLVLLIFLTWVCGIVLGLGVPLEPGHIGPDYTFSGNYSNGQINITGSGSYYLTSNLNSTWPVYGIQIDAPDAILDGYGKELTGSGDFGIYIAPLGNNATITNFSAISGSSYGINSVAESVKIIDNVIYNTIFGIFSTGNMSQIKGNAVIWSHWGIWSWFTEESGVRGGDHAEIVDNYVLENELYGIVSGGNHALIVNNIVAGNNLGGINAGGTYWVNHTEPGSIGKGYYSSIINNLVLLNGKWGIYSHNPHARIKNNLILDNDEYGIRLHRGSTNTTVSNNWIINQSYGLRIMTNRYTDVTINRNFVAENPLSGIYLEYSPAYGEMGGKGAIFDNYLANPTNVAGSGSPGRFTWTHPSGPVPEPNIINGPYLAGNYWSNSDGTGWSDLQKPSLTGYSDTPYEVVTGSGAYDTAPLVWIGHFINATSDEWTINHPLGNITYPKYSDATYITQAKPGAILDHLKIDGTPVEPGIDERYIFQEIDEDHYIQTVGGPTPGQVHVIFDSTPKSGSAPHVVQFTDKSVGDPKSWYWQFGDGMSSTEQNPEHTYTVPGTYTVSLRAYNDQTSGNGVCNRCIEVTESNQ